MASRRARSKVGVSLLVEACFGICTSDFVCVCLDSRHWRRLHSECPKKTRILTLPRVRRPVNNLTLFKETGNAASVFLVSIIILESSLVNFLTSLLLAVRWGLPTLVAALSLWER